MANTLGVKVGNQDNRVFTGWDFGDEASKTADSLIALVDKDKGRKTRAKELADSRAFTTSERIAGQEFTEEEAKKARAQESTVIGEKGAVQTGLIKTKGEVDKELIAERTKHQKILNQQIGKIDLRKIRTQAGFDKVMQDAKIKFQGTEGDKDRALKIELLDKEITARETEWKAKLASVEGQGQLARDLEERLSNVKTAAQYKIFKEGLLSEVGENALDRELKGILTDKTITGDLERTKLQTAVTERINSANIVATASENALDRLLKKGLSEQEANQRIKYLEKNYDLQFEQAKKEGNLKVLQDKLLLQQKTDKEYAFNPADFKELYDEKGLVGFDETDPLSAFRGDPDDPSAPSMFSGYAANVQKVLQTSPDNPQREVVLNALIKAQERFSDPRFYDSMLDRTSGEASEAYSNLQGIQNLMQMMGPKGISAIKQMDVNAIMSPSDENILGPVVPAIKAGASATYDTTQDVLKSLIENWQKSNKDTTIYPDILY